MKKIGVGFVGAGWMGTEQMRRIAGRDDAQIVGLFEKNAVRGRSVLRELGLPDELLVADYDLILANPAVDVVWLVSPNSFHGPQSIAAMQAGKHVFCEKPCATVFADYERQLALAEAHPHLKTYVDYILYFDSFEQRLRQMIAEGNFGTVTQIQVNYRHAVNIAGEKKWKLQQAMMGDAIGMGINHALSVLVFAMQSQAQPVGVYAVSQNPNVRGFEADPAYAITVRFDNGATGFCFGNIDNGNGYDAYHNVFGTEGGLVFDSQAAPAHKVRYWSSRTTEGRWVRPLDPADAGMLAWPADTTTPDSGNVVEHQTGQCVGHFLDCIRRDVSSPLSFVNSRVIAEIGWAALMAASLRREIALPLDPVAAGAFFEEQAGCK